MDIDLQTYEARIGKFVLCSLVMSKFGQIFESLLPEFITDLSETYIDETMDIDPQTNEARIRKFVLCVPAMSRCGQIFESLLFTEFAMALSDTHSDESMDI